MKKVALVALFGLIWSLVQAQTEAWMGLYIQGVKVGYTGSSTRPDTWQGKPMTKIWTINVLQGKMLGGDLSMRQTMTYWIDDKFRPARIEIRTESQGRVQLANADVRDDSIQIAIESQGEKSSKRVSIPAGARLVDDPSRYVLLNPDLNQDEVYLLDPTTLDLVKNNVQRRSGQLVRVGKNEVFANLIEVVDPRATLKVFVDKAGNAIKIEGPFGMEFLPEPRKVAEDLSQTGTIAIDLAEASRIVPDKPIPSPSETTRVEMKVRGIDLGRIPSGGHQVVTKDGDAWRLIIEPVQERGPKSILEASKTQGAWTKATHLIPSDSPEMVALAQEIIGSTTQADLAAEKLRTHVAGMMSTTTGIGVLRDAREVLRTKEGLCRDHAILLATLCRAAGIPARLVSGLIYQDGAFYYHAWVEAWTGSGWLGLDSTRNQARLTGGHLKLNQGNVEEAFLFPVLEGVKIEIVDVRLGRGDR